jgi:hypothetical protein
VSAVVLTTDTGIGTSSRRSSRFCAVIKTSSSAVVEEEYEPLCEAVFAAELELLEFAESAMACTDMNVAQASANVERNVMLFSIAVLPVGSSCGQASRAGRGGLFYTQDQVPFF